MNPSIAPTERVDLNEATVECIERDLGLTGGLSRDIVAYRDREGRIRALAELLNIPGFDAQLLKVLRPRILV